MVETTPSCEEPRGNGKALAVTESSAAVESSGCAKDCKNKGLSSSPRTNGGSANPNFVELLEIKNAPNEARPSKDGNMSE